MERSVENLPAAIQLSSCCLELSIAFDSRVIQQSNRCAVYLSLLIHLKHFLGIFQVYKEPAPLLVD